MNCKLYRFACVYATAFLIAAARGQDHPAATPPTPTTPPASTPPAAPPAATPAADVPAVLPTYSLEAVEVNGVALGGIGRSPDVTIAPGDVITAKIFIRDWSPRGEKLRAYQAKLDHISFTSGGSGTVQPVGYSPGQVNEANAYIDTYDPLYIHKGLPSIPLTDTASYGYRWLNVLINEEQAPVSPQDHKKYVCGVLKLTASSDATGTFKIDFMKDPMSSGLLDPQNASILPVNFEPLVVEVRSGVRWLRIESSDPPSGAVDGRILLSSAGKADAAWKTIRLTFNSDAALLTSQDLEVVDGTDSPPSIAKFETQGTQVTVTLDRPVRTGGWTTITHKTSGTFTRIGRLPGDVSNDGRTNADDLMVLIRGLNGVENLPIYRGDVNANGEVGAEDALRMIDLLTDKHPLRARLPQNPIP